MKNFKLITIALLFLSQLSFAQSKKNVVIKIQTSAECDQCKKRIESNLAYEKGVKFCRLDVPSKVATVTYNAEKTSPEEIKKAISKLGYSADEIPANKEAYDALPECCKSGGMEHK